MFSVQNSYSKGFLFHPACDIMYSPHNNISTSYRENTGKQCFLSLLIPIAGIEIVWQQWGIALLQCVPSLGRIFYFTGGVFVKKMFGVFLLLLALLSFSACGDSHEGEAQSPATSKDQKGRNYQDVMQDFKDRGFTNIQVEKQEDLVFGWLTKDGEVEWVSINGDREYSSNQWYPIDTKVIISYHTFPEEEASSTPSSSSEVPPPSSSQEEPSAPPSSESSEAESPVPEPEPESSSSQLPEDAILTAENCEDLRKVLENKPEVDEIYGAFSETYYGRTIQFNGYVANIAHHSDISSFSGKETVYDTIFDILIYVGDFDPNHATGPQFRFNGITGSRLPDGTKVGQNYIITAKVGKYNANSGLWELMYESMVPR